MVATALVMLQRGRDLQLVLPIMSMFRGGRDSADPLLNCIVQGFAAPRFHHNATEVIYEELRGIREHEPGPRRRRGRGDEPADAGDGGVERYAETTRRATFLAEMERVVPWPALCGLIELFYPKPGNGRPPVGVVRMLRIYFLQQWFNLSDPGVEAALYDSLAMRGFIGIDLVCGPVPDETTMRRFRHLLEVDLGRQRFEEVQRHLAAKRVLAKAGIIGAPSSTKNAAKARDPQMHQTKKGNQWYYGMRAHFGVDSRTKPIRAVVATPANVVDSTVLLVLLHGKETRVWGTRLIAASGAVIRQRAPRARDFVKRRYCRRGVIDEVERTKKLDQGHDRASDRVIKRVFGFAKARYGGLKKNAHRLIVNCALANLFTLRRRLLRLQPA
jgi:IS5 family transposase